MATTSSQPLPAQIERKVDGQNQAPIGSSPHTAAPSPVHNTGDVSSRKSDAPGQTHQEASPAIGRDPSVSKGETVEIVDQGPIVTQPQHDITGLKDTPKTAQSTAPPSNIYHSIKTGPFSISIPKWKKSKKYMDAFTASFRHATAPVSVDADKLSSDDVIIAVMGPTGSGKSTFINRITNGHEQAVGHTLQSCTSDIRAVKLAGESDNLSIVFVDTPGFDDTYKTDLQILQMISSWLEKTYKEDVKLAGILYLHRISDNRMAGSSLKNLNMFESLCGKRALSNVIFATTMWDEVPEEVGNARQKELGSKYFKPMRQKGAQMFKYDNTEESAWHIVDHFVDFRFATLLQEELVNLSLKLKETSAGQKLCTNLEDLAKKQEATLKLIRLQVDSPGDSSNDAVLEALREEYEGLREALAQTVADVQALNINLGQRIMGLLWLPRGFKNRILSNTHGKVNARSSSKVVEPNPA